VSQPQTYSCPNELYSSGFKSRRQGENGAPIGSAGTSFKISDRFKRHAAALDKVRLRPAKEASSGAALGSIDRCTQFD